MGEKPKGWARKNIPIEEGEMNGLYQLNYQVIYMHYLGLD